MLTTFSTIDEQISTATAVLQSKYSLPANNIMTPSPRSGYEIQSIVNQLLGDGFTARGVVQDAPPEWNPSKHAKGF